MVKAVAIGTTFSLENSHFYSFNIYFNEHLMVFFFFFSSSYWPSLSIGGIFSRSSFVFLWSFPGLIPLLVDGPIAYY